MKIDKSLYINKNQDELNESLAEACENGNLDLVKLLLTDKDLPLKAKEYYVTKQFEYSNSLIIACKNGHLDIAKYLLTSEDLKNTKRSDNEIGAALSTSAAYGHLDIVKFLLTDDNVDYIDIFENPNSFISACGSGELEIVKYLLVSPDIKVHVDPQKYVIGFQRACANNYVNVAKYLLEDTDLLQNITSSTYKEIFSNVRRYSSVDALDYLLKNTYINEHVDINSQFITAIQDKNFEIVKYFIFEYDIKKDQKIEESIKDNIEIQNWFKVRDLKQNLNNELIISQEENKSKRLKL
jgi:ankyrin repeat protein